MKELKRRGYSISPGTLYPILHSLENQKYLISRKEVVGGKVRKYYKMAKKGSIVLDKSKIKIKELVNEIFEE